ITKESDSDYLVKGDFTLLGVTKPLEFTLVKTDSIKGMFGETRMAVEIDGQIDRQEYGMKYHQLADNGGLLVGNKVKLNIECELV
ncbi:YceI family protein, partial [Bacillus mobilis]